MRIRKNRRGQFYIDDKPTILKGKALKSFLEEINSPISKNPNHAKVLAECKKRAKII